MPQKNTRRSPNHIPIDDLRAAVDADIDAGTFVWRTRANVLNRVNVRFAGKPAFTINTHGYRAATINGVRVLAHRAIWALSHGAWPNGDIDHINGNRSDNRIENLRLVSFAENHRNAAMKCSNTSGYNGVTFIPATGRWRAKAKLDGKDIHIGVYRCVTAAAVARKSADVHIGFHINHGRANAMSEGHQSCH
jgi:hypothetical protein